MLISSVLVSCDDFLDMQPTQSGSADGAVATVADAEVAMNGIMRAMTSSSYYGRNFLLYADAKGGDLTIYSAGRGNYALYSFNHTANSGSYSAFWRQGYYCVLQVNTLLNNIALVEDADSNEDFSYVKGQAYALRALFYFDLVRLYGLPYNYNKDSYGVPVVTEPIEATAQPTRASVKDTYAQILSDLDTAVSLMADDKSTRDGFMSYYAAVALTAKVKLYMEDYEGALKAADEVISSGKY